VLFKPNDAKYQPEPGDIVSFLPKLSHIGIVTGTDGNDVLTIEGNTNSAGSREGDRVARKRRPLGFCGTFIRLPAVAK
jgi:hypothetical protein